MRPPLRGLDTPRLIAHGAGEGPLRVAEQFAGEQLLGQGRAIDDDERLPAARSAMNPAGEHALAGAALAAKQNRRV